MVGVRKEERVVRNGGSKVLPVGRVESFYLFRFAEKLFGWEAGVEIQRSIEYYPLQSLAAVAEPR